MAQFPVAAYSLVDDGGRMNFRPNVYSYLETLEKKDLHYLFCSLTKHIFTN